MQETRVYGRNTRVNTISAEEAKDFCIKYHRQGFPSRATNMHCYSLTDNQNNTVLSVVVFCTPRTSKKREQYRFELLRMCFKPGITVVGGASKMIKAFIKDVNPPDFFTYQSTAGKTTDVYIKSGMSLVQRARDKKILVKDGLTQHTAKNNRSDWFSMEQVSRIGPDRLLGTSLGERVDSVGNRLSNVDLFVQLCGYHIETTPGDHVYEWRNPGFVFYTYKITAKDSDKYYLGRKSYFSADEQWTTKNLLEDGYYGSGGAKYKNWLKRHKDNLIKEIVEVQHTWAKSVASEKSLIGDLYKSDPLCLNSMPGGISLTGGTYKKEYHQEKCDVHGMATHDHKGKCLRCFNNKSITEAECSVHGKTTFHGRVCYKCQSDSAYYMDHCEVHGKSIHTKKGCYKCNNATEFMTGYCDIHGKTTVTNRGTCLSCVHSTNCTIKECIVHGMTAHVGDTCMKCSLDKVYSSDYCEIHGNATFRGVNCTSCTNAREVIENQVCDHHGVSKHVNGHCYQCFIDANPDFHNLIQSRVVRDGKKHDMFTCPQCNGEFLYMFSNLVSIVAHSDVRTEEVCPLCSAQRKLWAKPVFKEIENYLPDPTIKYSLGITSSKDTKKRPFVCPKCGHHFESSVRSLSRKFKSGKTFCPVKCSCS